MTHVRTMKIRGKAVLYFHYVPFKQKWFNITLVKSERAGRKQACS